MRGKLVKPQVQDVVLRITPARAGKTWPAREIGTAREDHPRACGENSSGRIVAIALLGSPPRVRGKQ